MNISNIQNSINVEQNEKGLLVRLTIEKSKVTPFWLNESIDLYLPINGTWQQLSEWPEIPCEIKDHEEPSPELDTDYEKAIMELPPDERQVMEFIFPRKGGIKRENVDTKFRWEEQKSMKVLNRLIKKGLVITEGESKGRIYKPKE